MAINNARLQKYNELAGRAKQLLPGDDEGLKELIVAAVDARLSDTQVESLIAVAARTTQIKTATAKGFVQKAKEELKRRDAGSPKAKADKKAAEKAAETVRKAEITVLYGRVRDLAESPTLLGDMQKVAHRLGVVNENGDRRRIPRLQLSFVEAPGDFLPAPRRSRERQKPPDNAGAKALPQGLRHSNFLGDADGADLLPRRRGRGRWRRRRRGRRERAGAQDNRRRRGRHPQPEG